MTALTEPRPGALSTLFGVPLVSAPYAGSPDNLLAENTPPGVDLSAADVTLTPPAGGPSTRNEPNTVPAPPGAALPDGDTASAVDTALSVVGTPYVWGGTTAAGLDCSGLLYYAFNRAGIEMPRYRAVDYGHMGMPVDVADARPGDVVYFDEPGDTDHVGLYLGNGQFVEAPEPGKSVRVSPLRDGAQIRRVLPDSATHGLPVDPDGRLTFHGDNQTFTAGRAPASHPGAQRDPTELLAALDAGGSLAEFAGHDPAPADIFGDLAGQPAGRGVTVGQVSGLTADEAWLIQHESDGVTTADNPTTSAFGVGQLTVANRRTYARRFGFDPDTTDPGEQLQMFRAYYTDRYGSAAAARRFWEENGYY